MFHKSVRKQGLRSTQIEKVTDLFMEHPKAVLLLSIHEWC